MSSDSKFTAPPGLEGRSLYRLRFDDRWLVTNRLRVVACSSGFGALDGRMPPSISQDDWCSGGGLTRSRILFRVDGGEAEIRATNPSTGLYHARCSLVRTSGTAISANHRYADVSSECIGGHQAACRYEFGDEKGRGRIRSGSPAGA